MTTHNTDIAELSAALKANVCVKALAGKLKMSLKDFSHLKEESIVELDRKVDDGVELYVNDVLTAKGRLMIAGNELGVLITEIVNNGVRK
ncbi:MAG: FliM/FliN family flagellar motor switch protein [Alphaproteobacteria bacterium]|nr:FliM/FliN family flagellar motor switch protein [Alphaproteobacteria bacterium]MBR1649504.1 FliM/FliN family flagellar motor switch protein [Alphaproteobacteria bacterium]